MERPGEAVASSPTLGYYNASKSDSKIKYDFADDLKIHAQDDLKEFHNGLQIELNQRKIERWMQQNTGTKTGYATWTESISWGTKPDDEPLSKETTDNILKSIKEYKGGKRFYTSDEMLRMVEEE